MPVVERRALGVHSVAMTFPLFLSVLFGAMATASVLAWFFSRGDSAHH